LQPAALEVGYATDDDDDDDSLEEDERGDQEAEEDEDKIPEEQLLKYTKEDDLAVAGEGEEGHKYLKTWCHERG
jgi:hypothetical protein